MIARRSDRKLNRLNTFDYSENGYYFVTICTQNKINYFGRIENGEMKLSPMGRVAELCWQQIPKHFPDVILDEHIVMPNHVHGIIVIRKSNDSRVGNKNFGVGNKNFCSLQINWQTKWARSLSSIIRGFKIGVTKWCRQNNFEQFAWQKSYYDHIIRNEESLNKIKEYIRVNPLKWAEDRNNLQNLYKIKNHPRK